MPTDFATAVKQLLESNADFCLQSSFFPTGKTALVNSKLNKLVADSPELRHTVTAVVLYPALRWVIDVQSDEDSSTRNRMEYIQGLLVEVTGEPPTFTLDKRSRYQEAIRELVRVVDDSIDHIGHYPGHGAALQEALVSVLRGADPDKGEISYYKLNKSFEEAVFLLNAIAGDIFAQLIREMTDIYEPSDGKGADDLDYAYIHHNTNLLLRHYTRIVWSRSSFSDFRGDSSTDAHLRDRAVSLLDCDNIEDMFSVTDSHNAYQDAYKIAEFMKLISESIEKVGKFPKYGPESRRVLEFITDPAKVNMTLKQIENEFGYGRAWFYHNKKIAVKLLSFCLWGCSPNELLDMVFDKLQSQN